MKKKWKRFRRRVLALVLTPVLRFFIRSLGCTWKVRISGYKHLRWARANLDQAIVAAGLHGRIVPLAPVWARPALKPIVLMVSGSKDGDLITRVVRGLGLEVITGSSGKEGARGFIAMLRALRNRRGYLAGMLVDGGRGPRGVVKMGSIQLAARGSQYILPCVASGKPFVQAWTAWDRSLYPVHGARVHLALLPPIHVPKDASKELLEIKRQQVQRLLLRATRILDAKMGFVDPFPFDELPAWTE